MRAMRTLRAVVLVGLVGLVIAGCGSSSKKVSSAGTTTTTAAAASSSTTTAAAAAGSAISIKSFAFSPTPLNVKAGATVTVTNGDSPTHTWTADDKSFSETLASGKSATHTFAKAGTYAYHCEIHTSMKGTVVVS